MNYLETTHPFMSTLLFPHIFPLYHPSSVDFVIFYNIPSTSRCGFLVVPGPILGASHEPLRKVIREVEYGKAKRSMFAETQRERQEIMDGIRRCDWNFEVNPLVAVVKAEVEVVHHDFSKG